MFLLEETGMGEDNADIYPLLADGLTIRTTFDSHSLIQKMVEKGGDSLLNDSMYSSAHTQAQVSYIVAVV